MKRASSTCRPPAFSFGKLRLIVLASMLTPPAFALEAEALQGSWRCEGGNRDVSFESAWLIEESGRYSDSSRVSSRDDIDGDSRVDDIVIESTERGEWSVNEAGALQFHVGELELLGLNVNGKSVPLEQATAMLENMISGAKGRVLTVELENASSERFETTISGLETTCTR